MRLASKSLAVLFAGTLLMTLPCSEAFAQAKGGAKGGAKGAGVAKVGNAAPKGKGPTTVRGVSPTIGSGAQLPKISQPGVGAKGFNAKGKGPINGNYGNRPNISYNSFGFVVPGYSPSYYYGGLDLGYPLGGGFNPYVLQGFSNLAPQVYSTLPQQYLGSGLADQPSLGIQQAPIVGQSTLGTPNLELGPRPRAAVASVQVIVPSENAELWFNGVKTQTTGPKREFVTPELEPGQGYIYEVRVRWTVNGKTHEQTRSVNIQPGSQAVLNFLDTREILPIPLGIKI